MNDLGPAAQRIQHPVRLLIYGRSTCGKTTLAVDIICQQLMKGVQRVFAVCPTFWQQPQLYRLHQIPDCFNDKNVFTTVREAVFTYIFRVCQESPEIPTLLLVDDAAAERCTNVGNKGAFANLCIMSPHLNLSIVGIFQRMKAASPAFRDNCEGIIHCDKKESHFDESLFWHGFDGEVDFECCHWVYDLL